MGFCPSTCNDITLLGNPTEGCTTSIRQKTLSRIKFYPCTTTLPDPIEDAAIKALWDDGTIVASSALGNIVWDDPITEDINIDECSPPRTIIVGRVLNAEDRIAVSATEGSPGTVDAYHDYDFWDDKVVNQLTMNYGLIFCDGDVIIPRDRAGVPLTATMSVHISYQKPQTAGGAWIEYKKITIRFNGDPLAFFTAKPAYNYIDAGITL